MDNKKPLAYRMRPETLDDIVGQSHLVGKNGVITKMLENNQLFSLILYGDPGIGKTTIASVLANEFSLNHYKFNASTDNKQKLKSIIDSSKMYGSTLLIVDEIHRMKKDIQDYLLPYVENGAIILIGLTTNNPYHSVNPAVRSRCHILKLNRLKDFDIIKLLKKIKDNLDGKTINIDELVYKYIAKMCNGEVRTAINMLEILYITGSNDETITLDKAKNYIQRPALSLDKNSDNYYNILSAFQKSIRGSDVNAALHYLARLIAMEDLDSILRRMVVIAYEDIGLANPGIGPKVIACCKACERVGFPEARIPLSVLTVDLALSPKSNSAYTAIDEALRDVKEGKTYKVPSHIINVPTYDDKAKYLYPHDYINALVYQQYLPNELINTTYYKPKDTGKYERALKERYKYIKNNILK